MTRVLRLGFEGDETPSAVVITPATDYLLGDNWFGFTYSTAGTGPLSVQRRADDGNTYPVTMATISPPWTIVSYDDYLVMAT